MIEEKRCDKCSSLLGDSAACPVCLLELGVSGAGQQRVGLGELPSLAELNSRFPQLEISRLIGRGGMGAIYQARQTSLDRDVALKLIAKEVSQDPLFVERFEREAKTLAKLSHPNIVTVYDFGYTSDGVAYLVMEFVDGINLREAIASRSVGPEDALEVVATVCRALEYAHAKGVIHRDIKPENILLSEDGSLKVVDFGIAKIVDDSVRTPTLTATRQVLGSLHYLAPEQLESPEQVDHRVDLYALGVIFYELLTGELPLGRFEPPSAIYPGGSSQLDRVVLKSLSRKPSLRYQSAKEFGTEIRQLQSASFAQPSSVDAAQLPPPLPNTPAGSSTATSIPFQSDFPFSYDTMSGFAEAIGLVYLNERALCIEFRTRDKLMGVIKSRTKLVQIPFEKLTRCELIRGVFSSKLVLSASSLAILNGLPDSESGSVTLSVKRRDVPAAQRLLKAIGFGSESLISRVMETPEYGSEAYSAQVMFGGLMIVCGILNIGCLAIGEVVNAHAEHVSNASLASVAISIAVLCGPVAIMQLVGGVLNFVASMRAFNPALTIVSMIPLTPVWLISFPAAIWASPWMRGEEKLQPTAKPAWGATTMMFIRESRWSRVFAVANALGLVFVAIGGVIFFFGLYAAQATFRIVGDKQAINVEDVAERMEKRLAYKVPGVRVRPDAKSFQVTVHDKAHYMQQIQDILAIEGPVQLCYMSTSKDAAEAELNWLPVAGRDAPSVLSKKVEGAVTVVATHKPTMELRESLISKIEAKGNSLEVELTAAGRESLGGLKPSSDSKAIGLMVSGLIEAVALESDISGKRIRFELLEQSEVNAQSLEAAMRGPDLLCELELMKD